MLANFLGFVSFSLIDTSILSIFELLFVPGLTIYYLFTREKKSLLFLLFLLSYSAADILHLVDGDNLSEKLYFLCNLLYIISFFFLILEVFKSLNLKIIFKKFLVQTIILIVLVVYLFTVLCGIIDPILFETKVLNLVRFIEHAYNLALLVLLAASFLSFLENDTKGSLLLFLGCLFISFSDFLLIGYYYLADLEWLNYTAIFLNIVSFILFYVQSNYKLNENIDANAYA